MRAAFNLDVAHDLTAIIEIYFTDIDKTFQLHVKNGSCTLVTGAEKPYTTRIAAPFEVWLDISNGKINGAAAIMEGKYKVTGDFGLMLKMNSLFGGGKPKKKETGLNNKKTNLALFLLPWLTLWIAAPLNPVAGVIAASITASAVVGLLNLKWELTVYERLNPLIVSGLLCAVIFGVTDKQIIVTVSYFIFSL